MLFLISKLFLIQNTCKKLVVHRVYIKNIYTLQIIQEVILLEKKLMTREGSELSDTRRQITTVMLIFFA